jgi:hypothetical protein
MIQTYPNSLVCVLWVVRLVVPYLGVVVDSLWERLELNWFALVEHLAWSVWLLHIRRLASYHFALSPGSCEASCGLESGLARRKLRKCRDVGDAPYMPFVAGLWRYIGPMTPRKVGEARESSGTRWSSSPEKLSHLSEVRPTFRDASGRSESALGRVGDEIEDVVDVVWAEAGRREQEGRQRGVKCKREMECRGSPPRTSTRPYLDGTQSPFHAAIATPTSCKRNIGRVWARSDRGRAFNQTAQRMHRPKIHSQSSRTIYFSEGKMLIPSKPFGLTHLPGHPPTELSIARFRQRATVRGLRPSVGRNRTVMISLP